MNSEVQYQLHGNRLAVLVFEGEKTKGGLFIPNEAKKHDFRGVIRYVGKGVRNGAGEIVPLPFEVGDIVIMDIKSSPIADCYTFSVNGEKLLLIRDMDVVFSYKGEEPKESKIISLT